LRLLFLELIVAEHIFAFIAARGVSSFEFLSVVLSIAAFLPYIRDTFRGETAPDRASWFIWSVLGAIAFMSLLFEGAGPALWFVGAQVGITVFIFGQSIWFGAGSYLSRSNLCIFAVAGFGLVLWYVLESPVYTLMVVIGISALGALPTIRKAARAPASETMSTWIIAAAAGLCAVASVGTLDFVQLAYPSYLALLYSCIVLSMWVGRAGQRRQRSWSAQELVPVPVPPIPAFASVRQKALQTKECRGVRHVPPSFEDQFSTTTPLPHSDIHDRGL
jgi:hypothetical protein